MAVPLSPKYLAGKRAYTNFRDTIAVVPARVRKPRDKSLAEGVVGLTEQWIVAPANEESFHTLDELNDFVLDRVEWLNDRPSSDKDGSRRERYEQDEREHMLALPDCRFETYEPHRAKVAPDYHVVSVGQKWPSRAELKQPVSVE